MSYRGIGHKSAVGFAKRTDTGHGRRPRELSRRPAVIAPTKLPQPSTLSIGKSIQLVSIGGSIQVGDAGMSRPVARLVSLPAERQGPGDDSRDFGIRVHPEFLHRL